MALLDILHFPDTRLRTKAKPVTHFDEFLQKTVEDMYETMYKSNGIGLAATQVNIHKRILVMDISADKDQPICLINPVILSSNGSEKSEEGCLSVPEYYAEVKRATHVSIKAVDIKGQHFEISADDILAICIQHEIDHLDGKLFIDYLSPLKQQMVRKKMIKLTKANKD